jgi:hypothetical protein
MYLAFFEEVNLAMAINVCVLCYFFMAVANRVSDRAKGLRRISGVQT